MKRGEQGAGFLPRGQRRKSSENTAKKGGSSAAAQFLTGLPNKASLCELGEQGCVLTSMYGLGEQGCVLASGFGTLSAGVPGSPLLRFQVCLVDPNTIPLLVSMETVGLTSPWLPWCLALEDRSRL